jgi:hypothetical protein
MFGNFTSYLCLEYVWKKELQILWKASWQKDVNAKNCKSYWLNKIFLILKVDKSLVLVSNQHIQLGYIIFKLTNCTSNVQEPYL